MAADDSIQLDLNNPIFQADWFSLEKPDQVAVLATLKRIALLSWQQLYVDRGLRWEAIQSKKGPAGERLYSFRISLSFRAIAYRDQNWLRLQRLYPDHDSAYR